MISPNAVRAAHPDDSCFFYGTAVHNLGIHLNDPILFSAAFRMHALNVASAQAIAEAGEVIATLVFDDQGRCQDATYTGQLAQGWHDQLKQRFIGQPKFDFAPHGSPAMIWRSDPQGQSHFGGTAPENFVFPPREHPLNYQYLGFLSNTDLPEPVAGDGLHLIFSMLHYDSPVTLFDISDPLAPKPFDDTPFQWIQGSRISKTRVHDGSVGPVYEGYEAYREGDTLVYQRRPVSRQPSDFSGRPMANASHASWLHYPEIPICPRTGEAMTFIGQIGDGAPALENDFIRRTRKAGFSNNAPILRFQTIEQTFGHFVFYHPKGQTLCILMQS